MDTFWKVMGVFGFWLIISLVPVGAIYLFACWVQLEWLDIFSQEVGATVFRVAVGLWAVLTAGRAVVEYQEND